METVFFLCSLKSNMDMLALLRTWRNKLKCDIINSCHLRCVCVAVDITSLMYGRAARENGERCF